MAWTDERVELLTKLHADGLSSSQIGGRLGVTRNSVISKIHRLGLANGRLPLSRKKMTGMVRLHRRDLATINGRRKMSGQSPYASLEAYLATAARKRAEVEEYASVPEVEVPPTERKGVLDLEPGDCRWPIGDPQQAKDFHFCNGKSVPGLPYCDHHCRRAYEPPKPKSHLPRVQRIANNITDIGRTLAEFDLMTVGE